MSAEEEMPFYSCTVNEIGPAANGTETSAPVIYINLTDTGGSFVNRWFYAAERSKEQMLSVGLAALSANKLVEAAIDAPNVPYSSVSRMYLMAAGGGTKLAFNQNIIGTPTGGRTLDPIDISQFAKIRFSVTVNGSGSIQFYLLSGGAFPFPDGYALDDFSVGASGTLTRTYDVAGLTLLIQMIPSNSNNQAIIGVYGH
jgi:hypothetical protein